MPEKHSSYRLNKVARERLERLAPDYDNNHTEVIEQALESLELNKLAFGQQVWQATANLILAVQSGDERAIGGRQMALAELLHSLPAATGITSALREACEDMERGTR